MDHQYSVKVDDNYHYGDESERYDGGSYATLNEAIRRCEELTIQSVKNSYEKGRTAGEMMALWSMFGEDPFIIGADSEEPPFSARKFVTEELCARVIAEIERGRP
jgi:hypothetical protein